MRPGGGKQKGAGFEREICRDLSLWMSEGVNEDCFWRSAMSGGRSTVAYSKGKRLAAQAGDISCIHKLGQPLTDKFLIECKSYKDLQITSLLTGRGKLREFWDDTRADAKCFEKLPMLIAKQDRMPVFVVVSKLGLGVLVLEKHCLMRVPGHNMNIILFDVFLKHGVRPNGIS